MLSLSGHEGGRSEAEGDQKTGVFYPAFGLGRIGQLAGDSKPAFPPLSLHLQIHLVFPRKPPIMGYESIVLCSIRMKVARILDEAGGTFGLEYDNTLGKKHTMRLDALTYEKALREARTFLEVGDNDRDADGTEWDIE